MGLLRRSSASRTPSSHLPRSPDPFEQILAATVTNLRAAEAAARTDPDPGNRLSIYHCEVELWGGGRTQPGGIPANVYIFVGHIVAMKGGERIGEWDFAQCSEIIFGAGSETVSFIPADPTLVEGILEIRGNPVFGVALKAAVYAWRNGFPAAIRKGEAELREYQKHPAGGLSPASEGGQAEPDQHSGPTGGRPPPPKGR